MEANRRSILPDILKLVCCFGVIIIHVSGHGLRDLPAGSFDWYACVFWDSLARFAVPVFFMCTGATMLDPGKSLTAGVIYRNYFFRVLWILLFWSWAYYIFTVMGQYITGGWLEPNWLRNSIVETLRMNHHLHLYYLQILLMLYALLPILRVFTRAATEKELNYALALWLVLGIFLPIALKYYPLNQAGGMVSDYAVNMVFSAAGYALLGRVMYTREIKREHLWGYIAVFALGFAFTFGATAAACLSSGSVNTDFMEGMSPGPALMSIGAFGAGRILCAARESSPQLVRIVKASFCVYLVHHFFVMIFRFIGFDVTLFTPALQVPVETAVVFILSLGVWWVLDKIPFVNKHLI